jgi:hypothetical protein
VVGVPVVAAALAVGWIAEGAAVDGVVRAVPEGIAFVLAFATLRRYLGISR